MIRWAVPPPDVPAGVHPVLADVTRAAATAFSDARRHHDRAALAEHVADGADGTPTMRVDALVEAPTATASWTSPRRW